MEPLVGGTQRGADVGARPCCLPESEPEDGRVDGEDRLDDDIEGDERGVAGEVLRGLGAASPPLKAGIRGLGFTEGAMLPFLL